MLNHRICMSPACIKSTYRLEFLSQSSLMSPSYSLPIGPGTSHRLRLCWITLGFLTVIYTLLDVRWLQKEAILMY